MGFERSNSTLVSYQIFHGSSRSLNEKYDHIRLEYAFSGYFEGPAWIKAITSSPLVMKIQNLLDRGRKRSEERDDILSLCIGIQGELMNSFPDVFPTDGILISNWRNNRFISTNDVLNGTDWKVLFGILQMPTETLLIGSSMKGSFEE